MSSSTNPYSSPRGEEPHNYRQGSVRRILDAAVYGTFCGCMLGATAGAVSLGTLVVVCGIVGAGTWQSDPFSNGEQVVRAVTISVLLGGSGGFGVGGALGGVAGPVLRFSEPEAGSSVRWATTAVWTCVGLGSGLWMGWMIADHGAPLRWVWSGGSGLLFAVAAGGAGWLYSTSLTRKVPPAPDQTEHDRLDESTPSTQV
jgi:hypothetical protein